VDVLLPDHPKLDGLSGAAKWTLVELWCYCGHHLTDGFVRDAKWKQFGTAAIRARLLERGLAERAEGGYQVHDYLGHQRSREEVTDLKEKRRKAGEKGGRAKANAKQELEQMPEHVPKQIATKPVAEAEAEAEADLSPADAVDQSSRRNARDDEIDLIVEEIRKTTGRVVSFEWAHSIRALVLGGRQPDDPIAYLRHVIRTERDPRTRFLPVANGHPSARPLAEAKQAAGIQPGHRPASEETRAAAADAARQAMRK
jgi:hypothetical protein